MKKDINQFISKEESMQRLSSIHAELKADINNRPTSVYLKRVLANFDKKLDNMDNRTIKKVEN